MSTPTEDLFPEEEMQMDSPRLAWMKKHGIVTYCSFPGTDDEEWFAGFQCWWPGQDNVSLFCFETGQNGDSRCGIGASEDEAMMDLAINNDIPLWNEV